MTPHSASTGLTEAIQELYRVFKPYQVRRHPEGCPCCVSDSDKRRLFSKPLSDLSPDDLGRFAWKALTTWGTVEDLKHFLPRLLELVAIDECAPFEREVLFGKLRLGYHGLTTRCFCPTVVGYHVYLARRLFSG